MLLIILILLVLDLWVSIGLLVAYRLQPKVARLAFMVLGSAVLWPLTLHSARRAAASRPQVEFTDEVIVDEVA